MKPISVSKRGALELSIGTIVVLVIGMSMLILGLVLVQKIFGKSTENVDALNDKVKAKIDQIFEDDGKSVVNLAQNTAKPSQGDQWGVSFAIRNVERGTGEAATFSYEVKAADLSSDCRGLTKEKAEKWIKARRTGNAKITPGDTEYFLISLEIPEDSPLCTVPYDIIIKKNGQDYTQDFFNIVVQP